jgi:hypothetical protein
MRGSSSIFTFQISVACYKKECKNLWWRSMALKQDQIWDARFSLHFCDNGAVILGLHCKMDENELHWKCNLMFYLFLRFSHTPRQIGHNSLKNERKLYEKQRKYFNYLRQRLLDWKRWTQTLFQQSALQIEWNKVLKIHVPSKLTVLQSWKGVDIISRGWWYITAAWLFCTSLLADWFIMITCSLAKLCRKMLKAKRQTSPEQRVTGLVYLGFNFLFPRNF